jgi:phosphate transport system substrate-binding protein
MKKSFKVILFFSVVFMFVISSMLFAEVKELQGAGATFPYPLYSKMFKIYNNLYGVKVNYQAIGSGGGIRQLIAKTVDFGASDAPMKESEMKKAGDSVVHIPMVLGAVVITYNIQGKPQLKLTPDIIADIFMGKIVNWNNSRIKAVNKDIKLPNLPITVVHRSDGSGTTFIFSDYLTKVNKEWKNKVGKGKSLHWLTGVGGKGNPGVTGYVKQLPGSIGYVELAYAIKNGLPVALIKNKSGNFIKPSVKTVSYAANINIPSHARVSLTNTDAPKGYPISSFTWLLLYKNQHYGKHTKDTMKAIKKVVKWMLCDGQKFAEPLLYAPLPSKAVKVAKDNLNSVYYK